MKITTNKKEARQEKKKPETEKQRNTLCSNRPLGHFLEADFKERVETGIGMRKSLRGCCFI